MTGRQAATRDDVRRWAVEAARAADAKQADDVVILDVGQVLGITDYFVICSARNERLVKTVAEEIERRLKDTGGPAPVRTEGLAEASWVLIDYGDLVVHVFGAEAHQFYDLERLWRDVERVGWQPADARAAGD